MAVPAKKQMGAPKPAAPPSTEWLKPVAPAPVVAPAPPVTLAVSAKGKVTKVEGMQVTVSVGTSGGFKKGDKLNIMAVVQEIKSPITGQVVKVKTSPIATIKLVYLEYGASIGTIVSLKPGYKIEVGQAVESPGPAKLVIRTETLTDTSGETALLGSPAGNTLESVAEVDWKLPSLRITLGSFQNSFFTTAWGRPPITYLLFSLDSRYGQLGMGPTIHNGLGGCFILRLGDLNTLEGGMILKGFYGNGKLSGYDYSPVETPDMQASASFEFGGGFDRKCTVALYLKGLLDIGAENYWGDIYTVPNIYINTALQDIVECRLAGLMSFVIKPADMLKINFGGGLYVYTGYLEYEYGSDLLKETHTFASFVATGGLLINITKNIGLGTDFEAEASSGGSMFGIRTRLEIRM